MSVAKVTEYVYSDKLLQNVYRFNQKTFYTNILTHNLDFDLQIQELLGESMIDPSLGLRNSFDFMDCMEYKIVKNSIVGH